MLRLVSCWWCIFSLSLVLVLVRKSCWSMLVVMYWSVWWCLRIFG